MDFYFDECDVTEFDDEEETLDEDPEEFEGEPTRPYIDRRLLP